MTPINHYQTYFDPSKIQFHSKYVSERDKGAPRALQIVNEFLNGDHPENSIYDHYQSIKSTNMVNSDQDGIDGIINDWSAAFGDSKLFFDEKRIEKGFNDGIIDLCHIALSKDGRCWKDHNGKFFCEINVNITEFVEKLSKIVTILPTFSSADAIGFFEDGLISHKDEVIAYKNENDRWQIAGKSGASSLLFDAEKIVDSVHRLLCHSNVPCFIQYDNPLDWFHGTTSRAAQPDMLTGKPLSLSRQGSALYCTSSLDEAINVYANQFNPEVMSKRNTLFNETVRTLNDKYSFVYKVGTKTGSNFQFSNPNIVDRVRDNNNPFEMCGRKALKVMDMPSPYLLKIIGEKTGVPIFDIRVAMNSICKSTSTFEVYMALNEMSNRSSDRNVLSLAASAMGLSGFAVSFPKPEYIEQAKSLINNEDFVGLFKSRSFAVSMIENYTKRLMESIPKWSKAEHLLCFDGSFVVKEVKALPQHQRIINPELDTFDSNDDFYGNNGHKFNSLVRKSKMNLGANELSTKMP